MLAGVGHASAVELTRDHSPGRDYERARILAAGGTVSKNAAGARVLSVQQCWQPQPRQAQASLQHATLPGALLQGIPNMTVQGLGLPREQAQQERLQVLSWSITASTEGVRMHTATTDAQCWKQTRSSIRRLLETEVTPLHWAGTVWRMQEDAGGAGSVQGVWWPAAEVSRPDHWAWVHPMAGNQAAAWQLPHPGLRRRHRGAVRAAGLPGGCSNRVRSAPTLTLAALSYILVASNIATRVTVMQVLQWLVHRACWSQARNQSTARSCMLIQDGISQGALNSWRALPAPLAAQIAGASVACAAGQKAPIAAPPMAIPLLPVPEHSGTALMQKQTPDSPAHALADNSRLPQDDLQPEMTEQHSLESQDPSCRARLDAASAEDGRRGLVPRARAPLWPGQSGQMQGLPGLTPRPLTLTAAVAEAIALAAYQQGSTDNLAALAVDLHPQWRSEGASHRPSGTQHASKPCTRQGPDDMDEADLAGEGADYTVPWHSTGLLVPQHGKHSLLWDPGWAPHMLLR